MKTCFVEGNKDRLFINTVLGCECLCKYCYLPKIGLLSSNCRVIKSDDLLRKVDECFFFKKGKNGTIISLGCYSECWNSKKETKEVIKKLLIYGNPIQFATKKEIELEDLVELKQYINWTNQLSIFVSIPLINQLRRWEINTTKISKRIETINRCIALGVPVYLYIKPVIKNVTILDIDNYIEILKSQTKLEVVLGEMFDNEPNKRVAPIGNGRLFYVEDSNDYDKIFKTLNKITIVYKSSADAVDKLRS